MRPALLRLAALAAIGTMVFGVLTVACRLLLDSSSDVVPAAWGTVSATLAAAIAFHQLAPAHQLVDGTVDDEVRQQQHPCRCLAMDKPQAVQGLCRLALADLLLEPLAARVRVDLDRHTAQAAIMHADAADFGRKAPRRIRRTDLAEQA